MTAPLYTRDILRLASAIPHQVGFAQLADATELRSPTCGARMAVLVSLDAQGRVTDLTQAVEACAFGQASAALMAADAVGKDEAAVRRAVDRVADWLAGDDAAVDAWPNLATLDPARSRTGRHGAILLPFRALLAAIEAAR